jgi:hypothetical protein
MCVAYTDASNLIRRGTSRRKRRILGALQITSYSPFFTVHLRQFLLSLIYLQKKKELYVEQKEDGEKKRRVETQEDRKRSVKVKKKEEEEEGGPSYIFMRKCVVEE